MITDATRERYAALAERVRAEARGGRWLVLTHDNPDPDALAAATLLATVLRRALKQRVTAAYGGIVGRAENREMVRVLHLNLSHVRHLSFKNYRHFALVDTQPRTGNNQLPEEVVPDLVIDHHPLRKATTTAPIYDVRPRYGATATILGEYMLAAEVKPTHAQATALIYAIRSETQDFSREFTGTDKALHDLLFSAANHRLLARIQNPRLPLDYFDNLHEALERLEVVDSLVLSHLDAVEQPDIVPEVADLLLRMEGKTWALATGFFGERLYLSIRTTNPRADAGSLMRRLLGRRGKGGGHGRIAGGWIDASRVAAADRSRMQSSLAGRLARELGKNPEKLARLALSARTAATAAAEAAPPEARPQPAAAPQLEPPSPREPEPPAAPEPAAAAAAGPSEPRASEVPTREPEGR